MHIHMHISLYSKSSFSFVKLLLKNHFLRFSCSHLLSHQSDNINHICIGVVLHIVLLLFVSSVHVQNKSQRFLFLLSISSLNQLQLQFFNMNFNGSILQIPGPTLSWQRRRERKKTSKCEKRCGSIVLRELS